MFVGKILEARIKKEFRSSQILLLVNFTPLNSLKNCRTLLIICDALRDLLPFVQFKKREKYAWRSVTFCNFTKINTPPWVFFNFLNHTNHRTKRASHFNLNKTNQDSQWTILLLMKQ